METRKKNQLRYLFAALLVVTAMGLTQCQSPSDRIAVAPAAKDEHVKPTVADTSTVNWKTAIAQVARDNIPAVVHIDVTQRREISNPMMPFGNDPFFHFFFNGPQAPQKFKQELRGLGVSAGAAVGLPRGAGAPRLPGPRLRGHRVHTQHTQGYGDVPPAPGAPSPARSGA